MDEDYLIRRFGESFVRKRLAKEASLNRFSWNSFFSFIKERLVDFSRPGIIALVRLLGLYNRGCENTKKIQIQQQEFFFSRLPYEFDKFRILHLSDLHFDALFDGGEYFLDCLRDLQFDSCFITGDFSDIPLQTGEVFWSGMEKLAQILDCSYGVYCVLGNHDSLALIRPLQKLGIRPLINESVDFIRDKGRISILGVDDPHYFRLARIPDFDRDQFSILLAHSPEFIREAAEDFIDLYFCGHTHGGQICLPGGKAIISNSRCFAEFAGGSWQQMKMKGYTSRGIGHSLVPLRFHCPPEISIQILRKKF